MSLIDYISGFFTKEGKLKKHIRRMADRDALPEDRETSAYWLAEEGSAQAILGLLSRFDMSLSQMLKDKTEKEYTYQILLQSGPALRTPLQAWLKQAKQLAHPLRMLEETHTEEETWEIVYQLTKREHEKDDFKTVKKITLLKWFVERRHPGVIASAAPFLTDFDEDVRYVAAEAIISQEDDAGRPLLLAALANPKEDSNRVPARLCEAFIARGWSVADADLEGRLPSDVTVKGDRLVRVR
jgi:hypothetical protein